MFNVADVVDDELSEIADDNQDQPPYNSDAVAGTFTAQAIAGVTELGNMASTSGVMYCDIPFGICKLVNAKQTQDNGTSSMEHNVIVHVEVLGFSEMEG
jgi:hypothetical protein